MERRTKLEIVNDVAQSMDIEAEDAISDSPEHEQIERIVRAEFYKLASEYLWDSVKTTTQLEGLGDSDYPTTMKIPNSVAQIFDDSIRYNVTETSDTNDQIIVVDFYNDPRDFLELMYTRNTGESNIDILTEKSEGIPLWIKNDEGPSYATSFDGIHITFDAYNSDEESTLQQSNSLVTGMKAEAWPTSDTDIVDLPVRLFPMFISKCKVAANEQIRQVALRTENRDYLIMHNRLKRDSNIRVAARERKRHYGRR